MSRENAEVVRAYFTAWNAGDMDAVRESLGPDVVALAPDGWPEPGPFVGRDVLMRQWTQMRATFDADEITLIGDLVSVGDTLAVRFIWRGVGHGPDAVLEATCVFTVRGARITRMEFFWDDAEAVKALRLEKWAMSESLEVVRDQYAATNERDFSRAMAHYDADVVLIVPPGFIDPGTYEGRDAVGAWFGDWFRSFDHDARFEVKELSELDGGSVLLVADHHARGRGSGVEVHTTLVWVYGVRDRKIVRVEGHATRADALAAAGLSE